MGLILGDAPLSRLPCPSGADPGAEEPKWAQQARYSIGAAAGYGRDARYAMDAGDYSAAVKSIQRGIDELQAGIYELAQVPR